MRKLAKPTESSENVFLECIQIVRNVNLETRLTAIKDLIVEADSEFGGKVAKGQLHTINRESLINSDVTAKELEDVYTLRMARKGSSGRKVYDKLIMASILGICPFCVQREVTQIDHYMPKAFYPRLSIVPINLVPSCSDCNKSKLSSYPKLPKEEMIHPYFDDIEKDLWLSATIHHSTPPSFKFQVVPPTDWQKLLSDRVAFHFETLSLDKLYATHAAVELIQINKGLELTFNTSQEIGVKDFLLAGAKSRSDANINSWQSAMYRAMADDDWFCNGGFKIM